LRSYREKRRDWPDEASATSRKRSGAKSSELVFNSEDKKKRLSMDKKAFFFEGFYFFRKEESE
jgi:hypothetical protein